MKLSHFDSEGASRMVDVGEKSPTHRRATASGRVKMEPETIELIRDKRIAKGDVFEVARLAGIMAAKKTDSLIPLCHGLPIEGIKLSFEIEDATTIRIDAEVSTFAKTGVEMEAMVAVSTAALTLYDMCKAIDRGIVVERIQLEEKSGGKSGHFIRQTKNSQ